LDAFRKVLHKRTRELSALADRVAQILDFWQVTTTTLQQLKLKRGINRIWANPKAFDDVPKRWGAAQTRYSSCEQEVLSFVVQIMLV
jgi:hypothetical protein